MELQFKDNVSISLNHNPTKEHGISNGFCLFNFLTRTVPNIHTCPKLWYPLLRANCPLLIVRFNEICRMAQHWNESCKIMVRHYSWNCYVATTPITFILIIYLRFVRIVFLPLLNQSLLDIVHCDISLLFTSMADDTFRRLTCFMSNHLPIFGIEKQNTSISPSAFLVFFFVFVNYSFTTFLSHWKPRWDSYIKPACLCFYVKSLCPFLFVKFFSCYAYFIPTFVSARAFFLFYCF